MFPVAAKQGDISTEYNLEGNAGIATGWTSGTVAGACQNANIQGTDITLLCQYRVGRESGETYKIADFGDSGSAVFRWWSGNPYYSADVTLAGILWGGTIDGNAFYFSRMRHIEQELGTLITYDFP